MVYELEDGTIVTGQSKISEIEARNSIFNIQSWYHNPGGHAQSLGVPIITIGPALCFEHAGSENESTTSRRLVLPTCASSSEIFAYRCSCGPAVMIARGRTSSPVGVILGKRGIRANEFGSQADDIVFVLVS